MRDTAEVKFLQTELLTWYDRHARTMPWRIGPAARKAGEMPDPYRIWMSEIMLQQTTVATVRDYFQRFVARWPRVQDLAGAADADVMGEWAGLGYYARARNLLKCARVVVSDHGGIFPADHATLLTFPGVGPLYGGRRFPRLLLICLMRFWMEMSNGCWRACMIFIRLCLRQNPN